MNSNRSLLVIGLLLVSFLIFTQWQQDFNPEIQAQKQAQQAQITSQSGDVPASSNANAIVTQNAIQGKTITIQSDVLRLTIDTLGGDVVASDLLVHNAELNSETPFKLLQTGATTYVAQSGLVGKNGIDTNMGRPQYQVAQDVFVLADGQNEISVPMTFEKDGVLYTKTFVLKRSSYNVAVNFNVKNQTAQAIEVQPYGQLKHSLVGSSGSLAMPTYTGGAYSSSETNYKKYSFDEMAKANLNIDTKAGWVAVLQHYFVSAWVPNQDAQNSLYSRTNNDIATIGYRGPVTEVAPNSEATITSQLWTGPKDQKEMEATAANLDLTVDYGWAWFIAKPLFALLTFIQSIVTNWGLAIIGVTLVVKTILYPLTKAQYTSMAKMRTSFLIRSFSVWKGVMNGKV